MEPTTELCTQPAYYEWTPEQADALDALREFLSGPPDIFVLSGYAGTGKTTLTVSALRSVFGSICFTAPTHKAVGVLWGKGLIPDADYATIHRLLGCKRYRREGESVFLPDLERASWESYDIIVVDEVSMVGETPWSWLMEAQRIWPRHVIFMGDIAQLPPVNDGDGLSPAFREIDAQLTEVMRSAGIVMRAANVVREQLDSRLVVDVELGADDSGEVIRLGKEAFLEQAVADFRAGRDAKVLAWTNEAVIWVNGLIRERLFGHDVDTSPQPGELLVVVKTWSANDESTMLHAEQEVVVEKVAAVEHMGHAAWKLHCHGVDVPLYQLQPGEMKKYRESCASLKKAALRETVDKKRKAKWREFYALDEAFVRLRPGYATTVHKSQGSTYETTYVIDRNLKTCHDHKTRNMLRYVAFSRASKRLVLS